MSEIIPLTLSLGSFADASCEETLTSNKVTHVLSLTVQASRVSDKNFRKKHVPMIDSSDEDIASHFDECLSFIKDAEESGGHILVHCQMGISRAPTIVIAFLMKHREYSMSNALSYVQARRAIVSPRLSFLFALEVYEQTLTRQPPSPGEPEDVLLFPLLRWIMTSNRSHLRRLADHEKIGACPKAHQFVMLNSAPQKEAVFQRLKQVAADDAKHKQSSKASRTGSVYAFHGSSTGNWHSIMRTGLKNLSNTKYMTTGAAKGPGIYMATQFQTSISYCAKPGGWTQSMFGGSFHCMAVCEVVDTGNLAPPVYVVPEEEKVTTRFLLVFPTGTFAANGADLTNLTVPQLK